MKADLAFLKLELRRQLNLVVVVASLLAVMPLIHRWATGRWSYWSGEWPNAVTALFLAVVVPVAGLILGLGAWAEERSLGTLGWLYSRPLSSKRIFALRVSGAVLVLVLLGLLVILFNGQGWEDLRFLQDEVEIPGASQSVMGVLGTLGAPLLLALGLFASAVAADRSQAMVIALVTLVAFAFTVFLAVALQGTFEVLNLAGRKLLLTIQVVLLVGGCLAFLSAAGRAVHRAPADRSRIRRALWVLVPAVASLSLALVFLARIPFGVKSDEPVAVLDLAGQRTLQLLPARGLEGAFYHPVLDGDGAARRLFVSSQEFRPRSDGGGVMFSHWDFGWKHVYLSAEGERIDLELPGVPSGRLTPFGWSPDQSTYGWSVSEGKYATGIALFDGSRQLRWLPFPSPMRQLTSVLWLDARHYLTVEPESVASGTAGPSTLRRYHLRSHDLDGRSTGEAVTPVVDFSLVPVFGGNWDAWGHSPRQVRFADRWVFHSFAEYPSKFALVHSQTGALEPWPFAEPESVGHDEQGEAVWLDEGQVFRSSGLDESPIAVCTVTHREQSFAGARGDWVLFSRFGNPGSRSACNLATGEVREWHRPKQLPLRHLWHGFEEAKGRVISPSTPAPAPVDEEASSAAS